MIKIPVVFVHGIGKNGPGYAEALARGIRREFTAVLQKILRKKENYSGELYFHEIVWDDILAFNQARLADIFKKEFLRRKQKPLFRPWSLAAIVVIFGFIIPLVFRNPWLVSFLLVAVWMYVKILLENLRTGIAAEFINDIISYRQPDAHRRIMERMHQQVEGLAAAGWKDINFISHSLGTVIASDYVWDEQQTGDLFGRSVDLNNFFTLGSPLPLFSLQFGGPDVFNKPFRLQTPGARWINIYDQDDPIAYPLKNLNEAYDRTVLRDAEVNVGCFGKAHLDYWVSKHVARMIAHKLALDWLRQNQQLPDEDIRSLSETYDRMLHL